MYFDGTGNRIYGRVEGKRNQEWLWDYCLNNYKYGGKKIESWQEQIWGKRKHLGHRHKVETYYYVAKWIQEWEKFSHV